MVNSDEEIARRRKVMAEAAARAEHLFQEVMEERLARIIKATLEEGGESMSVEEAQRRLAAS